VTPHNDDLTRRSLLIKGAGIAGAAGAASLLGPTAIARAAASLSRPGVTLPPPESSGIEHIVVLMMENRSFDHFFGWLPHANGMQEGLQYVDTGGVTHTTAHLTEFQGCGHPDPDHSWEGGRIQYDDGLCDGFLMGTNDDYSIGYYKKNDLAFYGNAAPYWTVCDNYFAAIMAETYPNRFYLHSAQTDRLHNNDLGLTTLPTIWDRLEEAKLSRRYYYSDLPFVALWGDKYLKIAHPLDDFLADCASGDLPKVSFIDPRFIDEGSGTSGDDHPHADIRVGQSFINQVYEAIVRSPTWKNTVFVITYDEWGGFFDHVPPPMARDDNPDARLRGFRVPTMLISPFAKRHHVAQGLYDHTSILKMIEWRYGLAPLTLRDRKAHNIAEALDFTDRDLHAPSWDVPPAVGVACPSTDPSEFADWMALRDVAERAGFALPDR
jgi:phospholipase C